MTTLRLLGSALAAVALFGCATTRDDWHADNRYAWKGGKPGSPGVAVTKDKCGLSKKCVIDITPVDYSAGSAKVSVDEMAIEKGSKDVDIIWRLTADKCFFYPRQGDGVFLKNLDDPDGTEFPEQFATNDDSNYKADKKQAKKFYWKDVNSSNSANTPYEYKIAFHCNKSAFTVDPVIFNEGN